MNKKRLPSAPFVLSRVKIINQVGLLKIKKIKNTGTHRVRRRLWVFVSRDVNHVGLRSPGALCFCDRASVKVVRNAVRRLNAVQAALSSGAGRAFVRSCARLLGLGHAVAHGVIFHSGRRRRTAPAKGMCAFVRTLSCHEKKEKTRLCLNVLMQRGTCLWREGSHSAEWTLYRGKGRRHSKAIIYHHRGQIATSVRACLHVIPSAYNQCLSVFPTIPYNLVGLSSFF